MKILILTFFLHSVHSSQVAESTKSKIMAASDVVVNSCESVLLELMNLKRIYFTRVDDSTNFKSCLEIVNEEKILPMQTLESCKGKKLGDMSNTFRADVLNIENDLGVNPSNDDKNRKVTDVIGSLRKVHHEMILAKCNSRERMNISAEPQSAERKEKFKKLEEIK